MQIVVVPAVWCNTKVPAFPASKPQLKRNGKAAVAVCAENVRVLITTTPQTELQSVSILLFLIQCSRFPKKKDRQKKNHISYIGFSRLHIVLA